MLEFITPIFLKQVMGLNTHRLSPWYYKQASHRQCHRKSFPAIFSNFFRASFNRSPVNCVSTEYTLFSQNSCFQFMFLYRIELEYNTICIIHTIYGFLREFLLVFRIFFFFFITIQKENIWNSKYQARAKVKKLRTMAGEPRWSKCQILNTDGKLL